MVYILLFLVITVYGVGLYGYLKGKTQLVLWMLILAGLSLRLFCSLDPMLHKWDERYHALVAKNMMEQPLTPKLYKEHIKEYDYKDWTANETWLHKQPVPLWTMALSMKIFGVNEIALRFPSILFSVICIYLTFFIGYSLFNSRRVGLIAAFLQSINGLVIELTAGRVATDHIDVYFLFLVELSIYFILQHKNKGKQLFLILSGIACGLAVLTKWLPALMVLPLYLILNYENKKSLIPCFKDLVFLTTTIILIAAPWQIYTYVNFPLEFLWEQSFNKLHFTEGLEGHGQPWWFFLNKIRMNINEMIYIILIWFVYELMKNQKYLRSNLFLFIWLLIPFIVFTIAKTKMQGYLLFTYPAYFIIIGLFVHQFLNWIEQKKKYYRIGQLVVISIFIFAIRYGVERVKPFKNQSDKLQAKQVFQAQQFKPNAIVFNVNCPIELMFYSDCIAYPQLPEFGLLDKLSREGYALYVIDDKTLPNHLKKSHAIEKIRLTPMEYSCH